MKTQTNLYSCLLVGFALFFQMGCGSINKMIDELSLDPRCSKAQDEASLKVLKEQQDTLSTVKEKIHDIAQGQGDANQLITIGQDSPITLLGLMIELEGDAGVQFPPKLLRYLFDKGMDIEKAIIIITPLAGVDYQDQYSPLNYAIKFSAANIAIWLLKNEADVSTVPCIDGSDLWKTTYTSVDDKVALLDTLAKRGFDFNKNITSQGIENLFTDENMSVADKIQLLAVLKQYRVDFKKIHSPPHSDSFRTVTMLPSASNEIIRFLLPLREISADEIAGRVRLLAALVKHGCDFNAADKMGCQILERIITFGRDRPYHTKFLEKILEIKELKNGLYEMFFSVSFNPNYSSTAYSAWETAIIKGNIELAVLLIKAMEGTHVKMRPLLDANGKTLLKEKDTPWTHLDRAKDCFNNREDYWFGFYNIAPEQRQEIKAAFAHIGIKEEELAI